MERLGGVNESGWSTGAGQSRCNFAGDDSRLSNTCHDNLTAACGNRLDSLFELAGYRSANRFQSLDFDFENIVDFFEDVYSGIRNSSIHVVNPEGVAATS